MLLLLHSDICTGREENGRTQKKRGCFTYTGVCLGWSDLPLGQSAEYLCRVNVGTLLPMRCILCAAPSWTDNLPQHRHQLSHLSNGLTVESKNWKIPFLPCLPNCKVSGCSYNRQMGMCWHIASIKLTGNKLCISLLPSWVLSQGSGSVTRKQPSPKQQEWNAELQGGHRINCTNPRGSVEPETQGKILNADQQTLQHVCGISSVHTSLCT